MPRYLVLTDEGVQCEAEDLEEARRCARNLVSDFQRLAEEEGGWCFKPSVSIAEVLQHWELQRVAVEQDAACDLVEVYQK